MTQSICSLTPILNVFLLAIVSLCHSNPCSDQPGDLRCHSLCLHRVMESPQCTPDRLPCGHHPQEHQQPRQRDECCSGHHTCRRTRAHGKQSSCLSIYVDSQSGGECISTVCLRIVGGNHISDTSLRSEELCHQSTTGGRDDHTAR